MITSFSDLIQALGGASEIARKSAGLASATSAMRRANSVQQMRSRDSIAPLHWPAFIELAAAEGIDMSIPQFLDWRKRAPPQEATMSDPSPDQLAEASCDDASASFSNGDAR